MNNNIIINDDIITKYLCGEASPEEAIDIEQWLNESPQNRAYFDNMEQTFLLVSQKGKAKPDQQKAWDKIHKNIFQQVKIFKWINGVAAVFLVGMVAVIFLINQNENHVSEIYASDHPVYQKLKDKSAVTLGKNSKIILDKEFGITNRKLSFKGKADFSVIHDEKMPFIIESQGVFIEDLGTVFSVESEPKSDTVYVVVNEGIVRLYDEHGSEIIIKAGEKAWYIRSQKKIITDIDSKTIKFDFKDTRLAEAVAKLEETYDIDIQLVPESIGDCKFTTPFFDEEVATIITIITETLGFKYQYQDHHYIIEGKPCK